MLVCRRTNPCSRPSNFWALAATFVGVLLKARSASTFHVAVQQRIGEMRLSFGCVHKRNPYDVTRRCGSSECFATASRPEKF